MRKETPVQAIKRRMAERDAARRKGLRKAVGAALWSSAIGAFMMMLAVALALTVIHGAHRP